MSSDSTMTLAPKRGRPRDAAKDEAILKAAGDLFMERGYEAVSVDAVALAAGVSKATIYARYADKEALFRAVIQSKCESAVAPASFVPDPGRPVRDLLISIADQFVGLVTSEEAIGMNRILVSEASRAPRMAELFFETAVLTLKNQFACWITAEHEAGRLDLTGKHADGIAWRFLAAVKAEAHYRATFGLSPVDPARLRKHIADCADEFMAAHGPARNRSSGQ